MVHSAALFAIVKTVTMIRQACPPWPSDVKWTPYVIGGKSIIFRDEGAVDWYACVGTCHPDICPNATSDIFCAANNCLAGPFCENRLREVLKKTDKGIGVFATRYSAPKTILGEYSWNSRLTTTTEELSELATTF
ncbi:hypothetical protein PR003_g3388 [Phytophthora rubi]|uniref:AWS domain-containing protein n=1 Tax=Phytophthora rubi TaxID=129364 RepID=A0A6A4FYX4_9STRA|nr:hypothetical protein PR002_g26482 [Phytophthora rubi]KAE9354405.1 hypothetical protein PR003_g3388 [Phytophthora rubi]